MERSGENVAKVQMHVAHQPLAPETLRGCLADRRTPLNADPS